MRPSYAVNKFIHKRDLFPGGASTRCQDPRPLGLDSEYSSSSQGPGGKKAEKAGRALLRRSQAGPAPRPRKGAGGEPGRRAWPSSSRGFVCGWL